MPKSLKQLTKLIGEFAEKRGWKNDDPNQLISSALIELGELAENYQWKNKFHEFTDEEKRITGYEFVDVLFYILQLARKSDIDIEKYFDEKLIKLEKKFPIGSNSIEQRKKYRAEGKNKTYD